MFDNLINRASELSAGLNGVRPDASSPGIDTIMEHVSNIAKSIDRAAHALDVSKHAALDYNASVAAYWANMTPARDAAKQLQAESDKANQLIALGVVTIGDDGEQFIPDLQSLKPSAVPTAFSIMDGEKVRIPERVQQDLQSNAELQRQIASTFRNAQPSIQAAVGPEISMINPPPPIPLSPEAAASTGNSGASSTAANLSPGVSGVLGGGRSSSPGPRSSTASSPAQSTVGARATAAPPRLDNATLLGAQNQNLMPSVMMQPGSPAAAATGLRVPLDRWPRGREPGRTESNDRQRVQQVTGLSARQAGTNRSTDLLQCGTKSVNLGDLDFCSDTRKRPTRTATIMGKRADRWNRGIRRRQCKSRNKCGSQYSGWRISVNLRYADDADDASRARSCGRQVRQVR
ncbi:hypothetical protein [Rhodococcus sp. BS-15]|uniref:hypothetical protein n=1 Tax=Rhodococcus sp. BS-15 TaxID=1304954 RepID=UPI000FFB3939|nr:hypothetical protein [Rhodococcus sp. BS-15]